VHSRYQADSEGGPRLCGVSPEASARSSSVLCKSLPTNSVGKESEIGGLVNASCSAAKPLQIGQWVCFVGWAGFAGSPVVSRWQIGIMLVRMPAWASSNVVCETVCQGNSMA
jgi:hypothetical protein